MNDVECFSQVTVNNSFKPACAQNTNKEAFDAFSQDWSKVRRYGFPPLALVGRCLRHVLAQEVPALVLIAPV